MNKVGYLFISNGTKPTKEQFESLDPIGPGSFSKSAIWAAKEMGWTLHMGIHRHHPASIKSLDFDIKFYNQNSYRNIFAFRDNWKAYKNLCRYLKDNPEIDVIHCNTPIGGVVGRLAGRKFKKKVIYTAHGFHFFKGSSLISQTILKGIERYLAIFTDILITINEEDFTTAKKFKLKTNGKVFYVPGVGIDTKSYGNPLNRNEIRDKLGLTSDDFVCICMGDIVKRKNYRTAIEAIAKTGNEDIHFLICGVGSEMPILQNLASELNISNQIHFLGFRKDIKDLLYASDCFLFSSLQEGLPRSTMEAMAAGLPCIVSDIRGNKDLIINHKGGYLIPPTNSKEFAKAILNLKANPGIRREMSDWNLKRIEDFSLDVVKQQFLEIFKQI